MQGRQILGPPPDAPEKEKVSAPVGPQSCLYESLESPVTRANPKVNHFHKFTTIRHLASPSFDHESIVASLFIYRNSSVTPTAIQKP